MGNYSQFNVEACEESTIMEWGTWCEGEESYLRDDDDYDYDNNNDNNDNKDDDSN